MHLRPNQVEYEDGDEELEGSSYSRYSRRRCSIPHAISSPDPACDENNFENCHNKSSFDGLEIVTSLSGGCNSPQLDPNKELPDTQGIPLNEEA
ncbi:hypothetical protein Tco_0713617 [Tanacetum coccineum]